MKYDKRALEFEEQAELLLERGLQGKKSEIVARLKSTNYYRLSSYLYTFRHEGEKFLAGTTFDQVLSLYRFDHGLRLLLLDALETIEVHARTQLAYHFAHAYGPFSYLQPECFPNFEKSQDDFPGWVRKMRSQVERSRGRKGREDFILHFYKKYGDSHEMPPIWMMVELMDFGSVLSFYRGVSTDMRDQLASSLGLRQKVVLNWLLVLNSVRNRCAHHARLWNWTLGYPATIPERYAQWDIYRQANRKMGAILHICRHWLATADAGHSWHHRVEAHFQGFPEIDTCLMGLPQDWMQQPIWTLFP
jgi:abortive infection bacteriophage resistance protein